MIDTAKNNTLIYFLLFIAGLAAYHRSLQGGFIYDDLALILREPALRLEHFSDFLSVFWKKERPIRLFTFYLDKTIWGINPFGFRLTNLVIHITNAFLLYRLLYRISSRNDQALLGAFIYLLHPSLPAAVAYVSGRKDVLGVTFGLLSMTYFQVYATDRQKRYAAGSVLFMILAFLTKEMFITIPALIVLYALIVNRQKIAMRYYAGTAVFIFLLGAFVIVFRKTSWNSPLRFFMIPEYAISYLQLFIVPYFAKIDYAGYFITPNNVKQIAWISFAGYSVLLTVYGVIAYLLSKNDRLASFLLAAFILSLLPVLQLVPHSETFADHYLYFPAIFLSCAGSILLCNIKLSSKTRLPLCVLMIVTLGMGVYVRSKIYMDQRSYWTEAYKKNPLSFRTLKQIADFQQEDGASFDNTIDVLNRGLEQTKKYYAYNELAYTYYYDLLSDLAAAYFFKGDYVTAETYLQEGLKTLGKNDKRDFFIYNLAVLYLKADKISGTRKVLQLIAENPSIRDLKYLLYDFYEDRKEYEVQKQFVMDKTKSEPDDFFSIAKTCLALLESGKKEEAAILYAKLSRLVPATYYELNDLAEIAIMRSQYQKAFGYLMLAQEEKPHYIRTVKSMEKLKSLGFFLDAADPKE